jgi:outer membrane protein assembly factor BamB
LGDLSVTDVVRMRRLLARGCPARRSAPVGLFAATVAVVLALAGCAGAGPTTTSQPTPPLSTTAPTHSPAPTASSPTAASPSTTPPAGAGDWPTYHHDAVRTGVASDQQPLGAVKRAWTSVPLDGALYAQPLVIGGRVLVATEGNSVYALDAGSGAVVWHAVLGEPVPLSDLPCGNIDPSGITGTPVVDVATGTLYVVANLRSGHRHELFALDTATGSVRWQRPIDPPGLSPLVEQERGALALAGGRVYVPFGGLYGDCGQYRGAVVSVAADGSGSTSSYVVPTSRMAGIWNPAGPVVDAAGDLWVTTGNSASQSTFDYGNAVLRLSPHLAVGDYFAPADWAALNANDADLGSLGPVLLPNDRVLAAGKSGIAYLLDARDLGRVGGAMASTSVGAGAYGAAAILGSMVFVPTTDALVGVRVAGDRLAIAWRLPGGAGPPIVAAGAVWSLGHDGRLTAVDPASGAERFRTQLGLPVSQFITPAAADGRLFVADGARVAAFGLR